MSDPTPTGPTTPSAPEDPANTRARRIEEERERLERRLASVNLSTVRDRVAWILNGSQAARDSDTELCRRYWAHFDDSYVRHGVVRLEDLDKITRVPVIVRERRRIQNDYRLFLASPHIREARGTLSEEERDRSIQAKVPPPPYSVYADESGKTGDYIVVGAVWWMDAVEIMRLSRVLPQEQERLGLRKELHFKEINDQNLDSYLAIIRTIRDFGTTAAFTSLSVDRRGNKHVDAALEDLWFHLLIKGIEHHDATGRAPLPRTLNFSKDLEEEGRDRRLLANVGERLRQSSKARFSGKLEVDRMIPADSRGSTPLQIADLFVGSIGRTLNSTGSTVKAKDQFAKAFLEMLGIPKAENTKVGDIAVNLRL